MLDAPVVPDGHATGGLTDDADRADAVADTIRAALAPPAGGGRAEIRRQLRAARTLARKAQTTRDAPARAALRRDAGAAFVRAVALQAAPDVTHPGRRDDLTGRPGKGGLPRPDHPQQPGNPEAPGGLPKPLTPLRLDLPLGLTDGSNAAGRLVQARLTGTQWRYEHLRSLATRAAQDALAYEGEVLHLMELAVTKQAAAQTILTPALLAAIEQVKQATSSVSGLAHDVAIEDALRRVADLVGQHLVLAKAIEWFTTTDVVEFWIGLLGALITDVASLDHRLRATGAYLDAEFRVLDLKGELERLAGDLDARLDEVMQPIEDAVNGLVSDTGGAMRELFAGFDLPLTAAVADVDGAVALDVNPLARVEELLRDAVREVRAEIKRDLVRVLSTDLASTFRTVMIAFVVVPVLAVLAVGIATGPIGAAVIGAVVAIGAQQLVHLILSWLSGPLLAAVDGLRRDAFAALDGVKARVADVLDVVNHNDPTAELSAVASQLRAITALLPEAFLDDAAELLDAARDVVVASAVDLALAAEQALGMENATAFDAIATDYPSELPAAPLLPGGADERRFSAQALLRDLGRLDQQRTGMRDSREFEVVHRVSLAQLLGSATSGFPAFRTQRTALVPLDADSMLGPSYGHGVYRALIKEVRPSAVLTAAGAAALPVVAPIPLTITHTGESRTRVRLSGNPAAPPVTLPRGLTVERQNAIVTALRSGVIADALYAGVQRAVTLATAREVTPPAPLEPLDALIAELRGQLLFPLDLRLFPVSDDPATRQELARMLNELGHPALAERVWPSAPPPHRRISLGDAFATMRAAVADAVRELLAKEGGDGVDADLIVAQMEQAVAFLTMLSESNRWLVVEERAYDGSTVVRNGRDARIDVAATAGDESAWDSAATARAYLQGLVRPVGGSIGYAASTFVTFAENALALLTSDTGLPHVVAAAFADARAAVEQRIAKWAGGRYEDDPMPAARGLGFVTLVRSDEAETACHSLVAAPASTLAVATVPASSPNGTPPGVAETLRYRPFENRGFTGTLRVSLPATLPFDAGVIQDVVLDVVVRACYDQDLADAVASQQSLASGLMPAPVAAAPEVHRVLVSMRAMSGVTSGPLTLPATLPLSLGGTDGLRIPLDALKVRPGVPVPSLDSVEVLAAAAAVIPAGAGADLPRVRLASRVRDALGEHGWAPTEGRFSTLVMTTRRPRNADVDVAAGPTVAAPEVPLAPVLASALADTPGVVPLFTVDELGTRAVHDVLLSLTYRVRSGVGTVGGGGTVGGAGALAILSITPTEGGATTPLRADAAPGSNFTAVGSAELVGTGATAYPCVVRARHATHVVVEPSPGTPAGTYRLRLNGPVGTVPALSPQQYRLTEAVGLAEAGRYTWSPASMAAARVVPVVIEGPLLDRVTGVRMVGPRMVDLPLDPERTPTRISFRPAAELGAPPAPGRYTLRLLAGSTELLTLSGTLEVTAL